WTPRRRTSLSASSSSPRWVSIRCCAEEESEDPMALAEHAQTPAVAPQRIPLVELRNIRVSFGGVRAVDGVTIDLYPGEVVGVVGGNGAGKTTLMRTLSGARPPDSGQIFVSRQPVTISNPRDANARALIMDEPTAALGPAETAQVHALIRQLKSEGIGIFLVSHDIHDVFDLSERISVVYHGKLVGTVNKNDVTTDEVLGMIILGKPPTKLTRQELAELHG